MSITVKEVSSRAEMNAFLDLPYRLYKGNPFFVPPLRFDEKATLDKKKNPAFEYCEARYWLAYRSGKVVGRIAAILNHSYIKKWKNKYLRFGWFDLEEDPEIAQVLLSTVESWGRELGLDAVHGPLGFTDLDHEGMLVEGFDQLGTLATLYNYPYYPAFLEKLGYKKDVDWLEYKIQVPTAVPEKITRMAAIVKDRFGLTVVKARKTKEVLPYVNELFQLINEAYSDLYGVVELSEKQIQYYTKQYFSFIRTDFVSLVLDKDKKLAGFGITMPSLSIALQKAGGSLFPFGIFHLLKALKKNTVGDLYLVAVRRDLQGKGVNAILMEEITRSYIKNKIIYAESNPELETNIQVQAIWEYFQAVNHKRRRCFIKNLHS